MRIIRLAALAWCACAAPAMAQWTGETAIDAFTDATVRTVTNTGTVLRGEPGQTRLVWREQDGERDLIWVTPDPYICDFDWEVQARFGDEPAVATPASVSTSQDAIFFAAPWHIMAGAARAGSVRLQLTDGCGANIVAAFTGDPSAHLPELAALAEGSGWRIDPAGFLIREQGAVRFAYRRILDSRLDIAFRVHDLAQPAGRPEASVRTAQRAYAARGSVDIVLGGAGSGDILVFIEDAQAFLDDIAVSGAATVTVNGVDYPIALDGLAAVLPLG